VACTLGIWGVLATSSIDSDCGKNDEKKADLTSGSLAYMGASLGWWQGRFRTDQDVSKIRGMQKTNLGLAGNADLVSGSDWRMWK